MQRARYLLPLAVFVVIAVFLGMAIGRNPTLVPSPLIGEPVPDFSLPTLASGNERIGPDELRGRVYLLNVWASWCIGCRREHDVLMAAAARGVDILGLNYKDDPDKARQWLRRRGNPYFATAIDAEGEVGMDLGVYGVPETYVIDARGIIRHKEIGPLTMEELKHTILPLVRRLRAQARKPS